MREKRCNSINGDQYNNCWHWHRNKMATYPTTKYLCARVLFHKICDHGSTECLWKFHENSFSNSIHFLGLNRHFIVTSKVAFLVAIFGLVIFPARYNLFLLPFYGGSFISACHSDLLDKYLTMLELFVFTCVSCPWSPMCIESGKPLVTLSRILF
jgi:hypothetical protein